MSQRLFDYEEGRAVDSPRTNIRHQIMRTSYDSSQKLYTLHYSVCRPDVQKDGSDLLPKNFIEKLGHSSMPQEAYDIKRLCGLYGSFISNVRNDLKTTDGFIKNKEMTALTYDISFSQSGVPVSFGVRPTTALMTASHTVDEATKLVKRKNPDGGLKIWSDFCYDYAVKNGLFIKDDYDFTDVTFVTTDLIKDQLYHFTHENKIDCLETNNPFVNPETRALLNVPHNKNHRRAFCSYASTAASAPCVDKYHPSVQATATERSIDVFNEAVLFHASNTIYEPFPEGTSMAVANYHNWINSMRRNRYDNAA